MTHEPAPPFVEEFVEELLIKGAATRKPIFVVYDGHYIQVQNPEVIGRIIADWYPRTFSHERDRVRTRPSGRAAIEAVTFARLASA
jgi:hypothetical protein